MPTAMNREARNLARREMLEADRERARIAYQGLDDCKTEGQEIATMRLNMAMPEYKAADRRFRELSEKVGNEGPAALRKMFR